MNLHLWAIAAITLSLLIAGTWMVQQRTGHSGWVDAIRTFSLGLVGVGSPRKMLVLLPPPHKGAVT